jgi:hypothetical protein
VTPTPTEAGRWRMAETGKGSKKALIDALMAEGQYTLTPEDIKSKNVQVVSMSLKNWVVILDHDIDDPIVSIHTTEAPKE